MSFDALPRGFRARIRRCDTGCWIWIGALRVGGHDRIGYGSWHGRAAHRFAYEAIAGPIPPGFVLDHLCEEPLCVNPGHLEPVTLEENVRRGILSKRSPQQRPAPRPLDGPWATIQPELELGL